jgi:hypothetical protein
MKKLLLLLIISLFSFSQNEVSWQLYGVEWFDTETHKQLGAVQADFNSSNRIYWDSKMKKLRILLGDPPGMIMNLHFLKSYIDTSNTYFESYFLEDNPTATVLFCMEHNKPSSRKPAMIMVFFPSDDLNLNFGKSNYHVYYLTP